MLRYLMIIIFFFCFLGNNLCIAQKSREEYWFGTSFFSVAPSHLYGIVLSLPAYSDTLLIKELPFEKKNISDNIEQVNSSILREYIYWFPSIPLNFTNRHVFIKKKKKKSYYSFKDGYFSYSITVLRKRKMICRGEYSLKIPFKYVIYLDEQNRVRSINIYKNMIFNVYYNKDGLIEQIHSFSKKRNHTKQIVHFSYTYL